MVDFRSAVTADLTAAVGNSTHSIAHRNRALDAVDELVRRSTQSFTSRFRYRNGQLEHHVTAEAPLLESVVRSGVEGMKERAIWKTVPHGAVAMERSLHSMALRMCQESMTFQRRYQEYEYGMLHGMIWTQTVNTHDLLCDNTLWMRYTIPLLDGAPSYRDVMLSKADQQRQTQISAQYTDLLGREYGSQYGAIKLYLTHVGYAQQYYPVIYELLRGWFAANTELRIYAPNILNLVLTSLVYDAVQSVDDHHPDQPYHWLFPLVAAALPPVEDVVQYMIQMKHVFLVRPDERTLEEFL